MSVVDFWSEDNYPWRRVRRKLKFSILCLALCLAACITVCDGGPHEDRLITDILKNRQHNKLGRPVDNEASALEVKFQISLQQIIEVDEKNEVLHTNMWLNYEWYDYKLRWNESEYGGVNSIRLPSDVIWTPDILMYNSADEDIDSKYATNIVVYSSGVCNWIPLGLYISSCGIDITWFPFDDQLCTMKFGSWTYDGGSINLTKVADTVDLSNYQMSGEWDLISAMADRHEILYDCCPDPYIDITYTIHIRRRTLYYGFNLIIPCALISLLALLTFILPPDAGEKIGLAITILLALVVFQTIVAEKVPATSMAVPLIGVYFCVVMFMSSISVVTTVLVLNFHHRTPENYKMSPLIRIVICDWLAWILRMSRPGKKLTLAELQRKASVRELEQRQPQSRSLLANVQDVDNLIPIPTYRLRSDTEENALSTVSFAPGSGIPNSSGTGSPMADQDSSIREEIRAILNEIRYITRHMKDDARSSEETNDWKWAAMVIDRLCLWIFTIYLTIGTLVIFFSAPHLM